jgi:transposase
MVCLDARLAHAALGAQRNKTDRNDARGLADIVRRGACHTVHVKSPEAVRMRALLVHRSTLKRKAADLRRLLGMNAKLFGARLSVKAGAIAIKPVSRRADPWFHKAAKPVIGAYDVMMRKFAELDAEVMERAKRDPVCRLLMTAPGVGPITALAFRAAVDDPHRFASSRAVAAYFGLTPRRFQSGESDRHGRISRWGDREVRTLLYLAAESLLHRSKSASHIRGWGLAVEKRRGVRRARVACARRLAVVLHRRWVTGRPFQDAPAFMPAPGSGAA